jgi:hypothetical protein
MQVLVGDAQLCGERVGDNGRQAGRVQQAHLAKAVPARQRNRFVFDLLHDKRTGYEQST